MEASPAGGLAPAGSFLGPVAPFALVLLAVPVVKGVVAITGELNWPVSAIPTAVLILALVARVIVTLAETPGEQSLIGGVVVVLTAMVVALFALVGIDVWLGDLVGERLDPWVGIPIGVVVIGGAAWTFVEAWPDSWVGGPGFGVSTVAVLLLIVVPPLVAFGCGKLSGTDEGLDPEGNTGSALEVVVLRENGGRAPPHTTTSRGWEVTTWTGDVADDGTVSWGEVGTPTPLSAPDADRVLLIAPRGDPARWLAAADRTTPLSTPTFVLLESGDATVAAWRAALRPGRRGRVVENGVPAADALPAYAVARAQLAPSADQDLALAVKHRPALFFDSHEQYPVAYNVSKLIGSGEMHICPPGQSYADVLCPKVTKSKQLQRDAGRVTFKPSRLAAIRDDATVYVHVVKTAEPARTYLDYWWYFPYNPAEAGEGAMCGAGLSLGGMTCFDHQSDWEGVTVELDSTQPDGDPLAVLYAQHNHVRRYTWPALKDLWRNHAATQLERVNDPQRVLVFPARGTHASYPFACPQPASGGKCRTREVPSQRGAQAVTDNSFDGGEEWDRNGDGCLPGCLTPFPTRNEGRDPASWNAFAGYWGTADCVLGVVCSESAPPEGPSQQDRYHSPWCANRTIDLTAGSWSFGSGGRCLELSPPAEPSEAKLVALGDSYSSGQGGGDYARGTTGDGNTCYRSRNAWSRVVAEAMDWAMTGFLACSGGLTDEVIFDGRSHNGEKERDTSQVSRITGDPNVITLTIGGNDLGFSDVVRKCVFFNCATADVRQTIAGRLETLKKKLPIVYRTVQRAAPKAKLVIVDYPRLLPDGGDAEKRDNCAAKGLGQITVDEVDFLNARTRDLDTAIAEAARAAKVEFVEVIDAFDGHEMRCNQLQPFVNQARGQAKLVPASFHPTATGYVQLADVVVQHLAAEGQP